MTLQWTGIDHVRVWSRDVAATTRAYATLFGAGADADGVLRPDGHGVAVLPAEPGEPADRHGGLGALVLSAAGDEEAARLLTRRGLVVERRSAAGTRRDELVVDLAGIHAVVPSRTPPSERAGSSLAEVVGSATAATAATAAPGAHPARSTGDVLGLDHVVVHTHHPDRALILWGARLGLDLRLDRRNPDLGVHFLFFHCGTDVIEVASSLVPPGSRAAGGRSGSADGHTDADRSGGLAWRSRDLEATRARLVAAGLEVSEIRIGRKADTRVATVREPALCLPTLLIEQAATTSRSLPED